MGIMIFLRELIDRHHMLKICRIVENIIKVNYAFNSRYGVDNVETHQWNFLISTSFRSEGIRWKYVVYNSAAS